MDITEIVTNLVLQLAVIIFTARIFGKLAARVGIPSVLGELIAGIVIVGFFNVDRVDKEYCCCADQYH